MSEETKDKWLDKLAKAARNLVPKDKGVERSFKQLNRMHEACQAMVVDVMAGQSLLETELQMNAVDVAEWEARARVAVEQDNEALAIECLRRKAAYMKSSLEYESRLPLMRQRRLHMHARFESISTIVHRLLVLKELLTALPRQSTLRDELLTAIKNFVDELPSFSTASEEADPSFSKAVVAAEQRITKLEQQLAGSAISIKKGEPEQAPQLDEVIKTLQESTKAKIAKVQEHIEKQRESESLALAAKNEDAVWEARQLIWSDEKTIESLKLSRASLEKILQTQVASPT